jgi:hypothetical protein
MTMAFVYVYARGKFRTRSNFRVHPNNKSPTVEGHWWRNAKIQLR